MKNRKIILILITLLSLTSVLIILSLIPLNSALCTGYTKDGVCYSIGNEIKIDGQYYYIDQNGNPQPQKADGSSCQNDFECQNNLCSNQVCVDIYKEAKGSSDLAKQAEEKARNIQLGYDVSISIQTQKDTYNTGEIIQLK